MMMDKAQLQRYWKQATADKRKFAAMVILLAVGLLMWGRLLLKDVPRSAVADPDELVVATEPDKAPELAAPIDLSSVRVDVPQTLARNLFTWNAASYPRVVREDEAKQEEKSGQAVSDEPVRVDVVKQAREELNLQSIVSGHEPYALINGQLLKAGQSYLGFRVLEIADRYVVVVKNEVRIKLGM